MLTMKRRKPITMKPDAPDMRVEARQSRLAHNAEAIDRWQRRLFRAASELKKLTEQRKRLLNPPNRQLKYRGEVLVGSGGAAVDADMNDDVPIF
jgi:hypothetical protein